MVDLFLLTSNSFKSRCGGSSLCYPISVGLFISVSKLSLYSETCRMASYGWSPMPFYCLTIIKNGERLLHCWLGWVKEVVLHTVGLLTSGECRPLRTEWCCYACSKGQGVIVVYKDFVISFKQVVNPHERLKRWTSFNMLPLYPQFLYHWLGRLTLVEVQVELCCSEWMSEEACEYAVCYAC